MPAKQKLIQGTLILTAAGLISRFMGFFFRIFLSHAFGEESVGLYQLIFPVYTLCFSLGCSGIQTALSRTVARKASLGKSEETKGILCAALLLTCMTSLAEIILIQQNADWIAVRLLGDARCARLLLIISYSLPCAAVHSCICGYCYGMQKAKIPALSQLVEQAARILAVVLLFYFLQKNGHAPSVSIAVAGIVIGEFASAAYSARLLLSGKTNKNRFSSMRKDAGELIRLSLPLTANRASVTLLQSVEAASIPACLKLYHHSTSEALSIYGVLTGMALPCILFPSALTNSLGVMLMPAVAEKQALGNHSGIARLTKKTAGSCFLLGLACCLFFLIFGRFIGSTLFHSSMAGSFILTLSWICPFLYTNSALISTINGLGKTAWTLCINIAGLLVRIAGVFLMIPRFGIQGYLWGLLASQFAISLLAVMMLWPHNTGKN